jgi:DNA-binding transcriptional LysR family regulator
VIQEFTARNPHVEITLIDARHSQFMSMIRAGEIDFALGTFFVEPQELNSAELQSREIAKCHLHVFCPTGHPLLDLPEVSWRLIRDWPVIALTQDSGVRALAEQAMQSAGIALEPAYEVSHSFTALAMVEKNLGVALLPSYTAALGRFPEIGSRLLVDPAVSHEIHLIRRKGQVRSKETDMLEDLIVRKINSQLVGFNEDGS